MHSTLLLTTTVSLLLPEQPSSVTLCHSPMSEPLTPVKLADQEPDQVQDVPTQSAVAKAESPASAHHDDPEAEAATATGSLDTTPIPKATRTKDADAAPSNDGAKSRHHVQSLTDSYEIYGVDAIWHNQYLGPESDFVGMRKQYDCDINAMILMVANHVSQGLYFVISMNATPHFLTVICGCEKMQADMPEDMFDDPGMK